MRVSLMIAAAALLSASLAAHADTTFDFSFGTTGDSIIGSGVLTATLVSGDEYLVTAVSGTTEIGGTTYDISGIDSTGSFSFGSNDNDLFYPSSGAFDAEGLSYSLTDGADVNLYYNGSPADIYVESDDVGGFETDPVTITEVTSVTPEPSSIVLLGTGLLGLAGVMRRRLV